MKLFRDIVIWIEISKWNNCPIAKGERATIRLQRRNQRYFVYWIGSVKGSFFSQFVQLDRASGDLINSQEGMKLKKKLFARIKITLVQKGMGVEKKTKKSTYSNQWTKAIAVFSVNLSTVHKRMNFFFFFFQRWEIQRPFIFLCTTRIANIIRMVCLDLIG